MIQVLKHSIDYLAKNNQPEQTEAQLSLERSVLIVLKNQVSNKL